MGNFNRVKFNNLYFSRDGDAGSVKCKLQVENLVSFRVRPRNIIVALDGTTHVQLGDLKGKQFTVRIETVKSVWLDDLIDVLNEADENLETINVEITGETGNFIFECLLVNFSSPGEFQIGYVADISIELIVAEVVAANSPN